MRRILLATAFFPACAFGDQIPATSRITEVTIYAQGARVVREVTFDAPAGMHEITLDDLPGVLGEGFDYGPSPLRILPGEGMTVGTLSLTHDDIPDRPRLSQAQAAAKALVEERERAEWNAQAAIDAIDARIGAAEAMTGFLRQVGTGEAGIGTLSPEAIAAMAELVGSKSAEAGSIRAAAFMERRIAAADLARAQEDLARAREALEALTQDDDSASTLRISLATATGGPAKLQVAYYLEEAIWMPVYDIDLARKDGRMTVERGAVVRQGTGEDWNGVDLTLSTARPGEQSEATSLYRDRRRIEPEVTVEARAASDGMMAGAPAAEEPVMEPAVVAAKTSAAMYIEGETVVYRYGLPVSLPSGAENALRLALDNVDLAPKFRAVAVPRADTTAFLEATVTNTTKEILLPGVAMLLRDGVLVGTGELDLTAPGVEFSLSFGPIDGLRISRTTPRRAEGETGIISTSNRIEESATLKVENKTGEAWDMHVLDQVPYSEQDDLEITWTADPEPTETDVKDVRGHLAWDFALPAGETREIRLTHEMNWPEGMVLQ